MVDCYYLITSLGISTITILGIAQNEKYERVGNYSSFTKYKVQNFLIFKSLVLYIRVIRRKLQAHRKAACRKHEITHKT